LLRAAISKATTGKQGRDGGKDGHLKVATTRTLREKLQDRWAAVASPLPGWGGLCYNDFAVKQGLKATSEALEDRAEKDTGHGSFASGAVSAVSSAPAPDYEDASRFCPVCSQRLESRRCKLVCNICGYYMSCADYY
jgi:hypothetical protein